MTRLPLVLALALLAACSGKPGRQEGAAGDSARTDSAAKAEVKADTLAYTLQTVESRDPDCKKGDSCTVARITFPDLGGSGASLQLAANLLRDVTLATGLAADSSKHLPSLEKLTKAFVDSFRAERVLYKKLDPEATAIPWNIFVTARLAEAENLVFLEARTILHTGGVHGGDRVTFRAYNRQSGAPVSLANLVNDEGAAHRLLALAEARFREQEGLKAKESYKEYLFKGGRFSLPENWRIVGDSLEFVYNPYEIMPFMPFSVRLPLTAVDSLFTPAYRRNAL